MALGRLIERAVPAPYVTGTTGIGVSPAWADARAIPGLYVNGSTPTDYVPVPTSGDSALLGLSAAWRCLHIITDGIGALEIYAIDETEEDRRIQTPTQLADPWPVMSPVEWRALAVSSLLMHGNLYMLPFDEDPRTGYPRQLPIVDPAQMHVEVSNGRPRYFINDNRVSELDVLHVRGYTPPGQVVGIGIVEAQRRGIRLGVDIESYQMGNLERASVPPVVLRVQRPELSETQADDIQTRWMTRHGYGNRAPAVLPTSIEVETIGWSPQDTQFLESKQYMAVEICWWFGIDPRLLGLAASGQSLTYSNVETTYVDLQRMSLMPWTSRIESALSRVLPRAQSARFDFSPMLRTTLQDRFQAYQIALESGWLTVEEVRMLENLGPVGQMDPGRPGRVESLRKQVNNALPSESGDVA